MTAIIGPRPGMEVIDYSGVPFAMWGKVSAVVRSLEEAEDLVAFFGDANFCPFLPVLLMIPGHPTVYQIGGLGYATAAELRDAAVVTWGRAIERFVQNGGHTFDWDALREKHGLMRREDLPVAFAEALQRRMEKHRRNRVTDPVRQPYHVPSPIQTFDMSPSRSIA